jgi:hypothetical protein
MMGVALVWVMQFHLSWVVMIPYLALSFYFQFRRDGRKGLKSALWFVGGAAITGSVLTPTFIKYGLSQGGGNTSEALSITRQSADTLEHCRRCPGRFLSFASSELPRSSAQYGGPLRLSAGASLADSSVIFLTVTGILQCIAMLILWFRKKSLQRLASEATLNRGAVCRFLFSMKSPLAHILPHSPRRDAVQFLLLNELLQKKN